MIKEVATIYLTDDYSIFKKLKGNRDVKTVKKIVNSLEAVGYVRSPVLVNENMEVIDGQHRLEALKEKGLPVEFMKQEGIGLKECQALNIGQSNWTTMQFIKSYADEGEPSYIRLLNLIDDFKKDFGVEGVILMTKPKLIATVGGSSIYGPVRSGELDISEYDYEVTRMRLTSAVGLGFVDFKNKYSMYGRSWWSSVSYAYQHQNVEVKELIRKLNDNPRDIIACNKVVDQLRYFDEAYNKGKRAENKVFMATDYQKRLYL